MSAEGNPYQAPETTIVERPAPVPRPLLVFLAGASCICLSIPFLLLAAALVWWLVSVFVGSDWLEALTRPRLGTDILALILFTGCGTTLLMAGRLFLARRGRRGRHLLLAFAAIFCGLIALIFETPR